MPNPDAAAENRLAFARLLSQDDATLDLAVGCLHVSAEARPGLPFGPTLERLDRLAEQVAEHLENLAQLDALHQVLYEDFGLRGDRLQYYDPRNSLLDEVLERRLGLPITLAVVELEVARRVGIRLHGIGFPGHFLVGTDDGEVIDPFDRGRRLQPSDLQALLAHGHHDPANVAIPRELLRPASKREILVRILNNLRGIFVARQLPSDVLWVLELLLILRPGDPSLERDRGLALAHLGQYNGARAALARYLDENPTAPDAAWIRGLVGTLRGRLN